MKGLAPPVSGSQRERRRLLARELRAVGEEGLVSFRHRPRSHSPPRQRWVNPVDDLSTYRLSRFSDELVRCTGHLRSCGAAAEINARDPHFAFFDLDHVGRYGGCRGKRPTEPVKTPMPWRSILQSLVGFVHEIARLTCRTRKPLVLGTT